MSKKRAVKKPTGCAYCEYEGPTIRARISRFNRRTCLICDVCGGRQSTKDSGRLSRPLSDVEVR